MKKFFTFKPLLLFSFAVLLFSGCKKTGPPGPQGPPGETGKTNISSTIFTMSTWAYSSPYHYRNLSVPDLTTNNIDSALVMVYFSTIGSNWFALPYTQYNYPSDYYMGFVCSAGNVQVTWFYDSSLSSGSDPNSYYGTTIRCKVVVVPPDIRKANPNVNWNDYNEVRKAFVLNEELAL